MKSFQTFTKAVSPSLLIVLSSCGDLVQPLEGGGALLDPGMTAGGMGSMTPTGTSTDNRPQFHLAHIASATAEQRRSAESSARQALESSSVVTEVKKRKVQYVAVPVKRSKGQKEGGTHVMKVNVATGVSTGEVFVADKGEPKSGDKLKLGGDSTLYLALTGDKL